MSLPPRASGMKAALATARLAFHAPSRQARSADAPASEAASAAANVPSPSPTIASMRPCSERTAATAASASASGAGPTFSHGADAPSSAQRRAASRAAADPSAPGETAIATTRPSSRPSRSSGPSPGRRTLLGAGGSIGPELMGAGALGSARHGGTSPPATHCAAAAWGPTAGHRARNPAAGRRGQAAPDLSEHPLGAAGEAARPGPNHDALALDLRPGAGVPG